MTDAPVTRLDGYDRDGRHVGDGHGRPWGWSVFLDRDGFYRHCRTEADARRLLAEAGAVEVRAGDGRES